VDNNLQCLVSIGTGVTSFQPFNDSALGILGTLTRLVTETESTAEKFRKDKSHLHDEGRYFRFNVRDGLGDVGLEEWRKKSDIAAVTRRYLESEDVYEQMAHCAASLAYTMS
jgi:hypothetical protein